MPEIRQVGHPHRDELFNSWRDQAVSVLTPVLALQLGNQEILRRAVEVGRIAMRGYDAEVAAGVPPDQAYQNALTPQSPAAAELERQKEVGYHSGSDAKGNVIGDGSKEGGSSALNTPNLITDEDLKKASDVSRDAIGSDSIYRDVLNRPAPQITGGTVDPITGARLDSAKLQDRTVVEDTNFNTQAGNEARGIQLRNLADLQATARGEGAAQQAYAARLKAALLKSGQQTAGQIQQARGFERRGLRRDAILRGSEDKLQAEIANQAQSAQESQAAQQQVGQQAGDVRKTDVDIEKTRADFESRKKNLQAQLDAAREAGNTDAINDFTKKIADLENDIKKFNSGIQEGNIERDIDVQKENVTTKREDTDQKLKAQEKMEASASNLTAEHGREEALKIAKRELELAELRFQAARDDAERARASESRNFWAGVIERLAGIAIQATKPTAKRGGLISEPTLVAEGDDEEIVIPVTGVTPSLRKAFSVSAQPFQKPVNIQALLGALKGSMPSHEDKTPEGLAMHLAASNQKYRKGMY